jgi:hypothetical protein
MGNTMRDSRPISVSMAAIVAAAAFGGMAVLCIPGLSFLFQLIHLAANDSGPAIGGTASSDTWMTVAVLAPLFCAVLGLVSGTFMASMFNLFVRQAVRRKQAGEAVQRVRVASIGARPKAKILLYARDVPGEPETIRVQARRARSSPVEF